MAIINYFEKHLKTFTAKSIEHNFWEIICVTDGYGTIKTDDNQIVEYKKGETILIPPNIHYVNSSPVGFKNINLSIEGWNPPIQKALLIPDYTISRDFYNIVKPAYHYFHKFPINHPINVAYATVIEAFLNILIQQTSTASISQIIINEIVNNYTDANFDLNQAYNSVPLSKEYIRKLFIREYGISPSKFLLEKRLTLAKQLLLKKKESYLRINEIAVTCGFGDQAYFCRVFRRETGVSPREFQLKFSENKKTYSSNDK